MPPPPRSSSPISRDDADRAEKLRKIKMGRQNRKEEEKAAVKTRQEEVDKDKEWEDSMVTTLEYLFNGVVALVAASLPASETPPDYVTAGVVVAANVLLNLMFRSTWLDRVVLYAINLMLPACGDTIKKLDSLPGHMEPISWLLFLSTNALAIALGYWYYVRKAKTTSDSEWRQNVLAFAVVAVNVAAGVATGVLSVWQVLRWLNVLKNVVLHWTVKGA